MVACPTPPSGTVQEYQKYTNLLGETTYRMNCIGLLKTPECVDYVHLSPNDDDLSMKVSWKVFAEAAKRCVEEGPYDFKVVFKPDDDDDEASWMERYYFNDTHDCWAYSRYPYMKKTHDNRESGPCRVIGRLHSSEKRMLLQHMVLQLGASADT
jgi:hypothetical protein